MYFASGAGAADLTVEVVLLPLGEARGLVLGEIRLHRKGGLRQIEGGFERLGLAFGLVVGSFGYVRHSIP